MERAFSVGVRWLWISVKACNTTSKDKSEDPVAHESYDNVMNAMLTVSTFAAAITFNIILKPNIDGEPAPGLLYLSYAVCQMIRLD
jgi:hypothetical protein